jgi:short-subunit dehydrogenase
VATSTRKLAVVTGASSGIGYELARIAADEGYDLLIAANEDEINTAAGELKTKGVRVTAVVADLATSEGVRQLVDGINANPASLELLFANAGCGLGKAFLDQDMVDVKHVVNTNVTGTVELIHAVGNMMRRQRRGRILITGSIAGFMPGSFQAVYNATKAFLNSFSFALRNELKDSGVCRAGRNRIIGDLRADACGRQAAAPRDLRGRTDQHAPPDRRDQPLHRLYGSGP